MLISGNVFIYHYAMKIPKTLGYQLKACGKKALPKTLELPAGRYRLDRVFKHDFFAATALYGFDNSASPIPAPPRVVLKIARQSDFLGVPLRWLGQAIARHEWSILTRLQDLPGLPRLIARYGNDGVIYRYIEGRSLDENPGGLPDDFFDRLLDLLSKIHQRRIAYVDMNKRGNILIAADQSPCLIDFQIACFIPPMIFGLHAVARSILDILQKEDCYHLYKHKRRLRPDLMNDRELEQSRRVSFWILIHRALAAPYRRLRRGILRNLYRHDTLVDGQVYCANPETDPVRWNKK
jgi:hypothetical protein